jgi:hypothetical protein
METIVHSIHIHTIQSTAFLLYRTLLELNRVAARAAHDDYETNNLDGGRGGCHLDILWLLWFLFLVYERRDLCEAAHENAQRH